MLRPGDGVLIAHGGARYGWLTLSWTEDQWRSRSRGRIFRSSVGTTRRNSENGNCEKQICRSNPESAPVSARGILSRLLAGLFGLAAMAVLLAACHGSSGRTDQSYWRNIYGDPDTGGSVCCTRAEGGVNR